LFCGSWAWKHVEENGRDQMRYDSGM
jgi:hypothetical protein